jgi:hypothetical protein
MIRRRRPVREIPFSFDSFLDIVANVVGIIIRLILVVWVGARSYSTLQMTAKALPRPAKVNSTVNEVSDPLEAALGQHSRELALAQERLLAELRRLQEVAADETQARSQLVALDARRQRLMEDKQTIEQTAKAGAAAMRAAALSSADLQQRIQSLAQEIHALEHLPPLKRTLHYRTPVSQPVNSEELLFECNHNRVTFIDIAAMLNEVRNVIEEKAKLLRAQWRVSDVAGPIGPFRLQYAVERERSLLDAVAGQAVPEGSGGFRYGVSDWQLEPILPERGDTAEAALTEGSEFRQIIDRIDPQQTVVTFWVYPDSFALFRRLRDFLYEREVVVAGRPLPEGVPIASSRRGTVSRGQ